MSNRCPIVKMVDSRMSNETYDSDILSWSEMITSCCKKLMEVDNGRL